MFNTSVEEIGHVGILLGFGRVKLRLATLA